MPADEPSNWDIVRRLNALEDDQKHLEKALAEAKERGEEKYVRRDFWNEARKFDQAVVANLADEVSAIKEDRKGDAGFRRQMWLALAIAAIGLMGSVAVALFGLLTR